MPIRIIENTKEHVVADYIGKVKSVAGIEILGNFSDIKVAREAVASYLLTKSIINAGQYLGFISAIKHPRPKEYYSKLGILGTTSRWGKKK